ncbi:MAG: hypothetical protein AAFU67_12515 [Bacteroidota bacterium]
MPSKKQKSSDGPYAESFKPAVVFGSPTVDQMLNQIYLKEIREYYTEEGYQMVYSSLTHDSQPNELEGQPLYLMETSDSNITPYIRPVIVKGKEDYKNNSYVLENGANEQGVCVVLLKEVSDSGEVYCNLRFLPYAYLQDLILDSQSEVVKIDLPDTDIIKLNVTLKPSSTGETLYKTHKTEIIIESAPEEEIIKTKAALELEGAKFIANYADKLLIHKLNDSAGNTHQMVLGDSLSSNSENNGHSYPITRRQSLGIATTSGYLQLFSASAALLEFSVRGMPRQPRLFWGLSSVFFGLVAHTTRTADAYRPTNWSQ